MFYFILMSTLSFVTGRVCTLVTSCWTNFKIKTGAGCFSFNVVCFVCTQLLYSMHWALLTLRIWVCIIYNAHCLSFFNSTVIAHAGDGNFHVVVQFDPTKEEQPREVVRLTTSWSISRYHWKVQVAFFYVLVTLLFPGQFPCNTLPKKKEI